MASSANALSPAQVDLALGPELPNAAADTTANEAGAANAVSSNTSADAAAVAAPERVQNRDQEAPANDSGEEVPANENNVEE